MAGPPAVGHPAPGYMVMGSDLDSLVDSIRKQMAASGAVPPVAKKPDDSAKKAVSREGRSVQQVIAFSTPSFPA